MQHIRINIIFLFCLVSFLLAETPVVGLWVVRNSLQDASRIDTMLITAYKLGFTDLFVQVRGRGDAFYHSRWEPPADSLATGFDPLAYLLQHPLRKKFRIHAWINVFYVWSQPTPPASSEHIVNRHPEWLERPANLQLPTSFTTLWRSFRNGEGLFLSPHVNDAQLHLLRIIQDLITQYSVDGVHLDYIRYPGAAFGFHPAGVAEFEAQYQMNPLILRNPLSLTDQSPSHAYELILERWAKFLQHQLTRFVWRVHKVIQKHKPHLLLTAAVKPDPSRARWEYYQDWEAWINEGLIDWALPMNYTANPELFLWRIQQMVDRLPPDKLVMGISLFNQSAAEALKKIEMAQDIQLKGVVLFSFNQIKNNSILQDLLEERITQEYSHETRNSRPPGQ